MEIRFLAPHLNTIHPVTGIDPLHDVVRIDGHGNILCRGEFLHYESNDPVVKDNENYAFYNPELARKSSK